MFFPSVPPQNLDPDSNQGTAIFFLSFFSHFQVFCDETLNFEMKLISIC